MTWEYIQIMMTTRPVKDEHSRIVVLGQGEPEQVASGTRLIDLLGKLGEEGWELAGVMDMGSVVEDKGAHDLRLPSPSLFLKRSAES